MIKLPKNGGVSHRWKSCLTCNKKFYTHDIPSKRKNCSIYCLRKYQKANPKIFTAEERKNRSKILLKIWDTGIRTRTGWMNEKNGYKGITIHYKKKYEHRRIMESILGRELTFNENVHHKDGNKLNNDPNNLELMSRSEHSRLHNLKRYAHKHIKIQESNNEQLPL